MQLYEEERGQQFALKIYSDLLDTIDTLAQKPTIGTLDEQRPTSKTKYYRFLSHPKYRIVYRFTKTTLYIVTIRATMTKRN